MDSSESIISIQKAAEPNHLHKHAVEFFSEVESKCIKKISKTMIKSLPVFWHYFRTAEKSFSGDLQFYILVHDK